MYWQIITCFSDFFRNRFSESWIGKLDPEKAKQVSDVIIAAKSEGTYKHYVSQFRKWVIYCDDFHIDPLSMPPDPFVYIFWIQDRINSSGSIASKDSWTAMMNWLCEIHITWNIILEILNAIRGH